MKSKVLHLSRHLWLLLLYCLPHLAAFADEPAEPPEFLLGINLNGPAVEIDGLAWQGADSKSYICDDKAFNSQQIELTPPTDAQRAVMIRSSRWGGNRIELQNLPATECSLFLYVWEDNAAENYSISVNGRLVQPRYNSGRAGHWEKLGPWYVTPKDGKILITSQGGAANFSGIELWRGRHDGINLPITEEQLAFFEKRIRPVLAEKCYECHSAESDDLAGELLVDSRAAIRRGGTGGPAVVPGDVKHSLLIEAIHYQNDELQMPPDQPLSAAQIADFEQWIQMGAPDPRSTATKHLGKQIDVAAAREFWSLKPIQNSPLPSVQNAAWPRGAIDHFILAKQESLGLAPAADADKRTLIRRATYDLIGLPPTPAEVAAFIADPSPSAFATVVDRLLNSPRYGERWGRHWLDVVRYADTAGDNSDFPIPQMHRYRDWVIAAFNRDLPYDEFVRDQLAGDLRGGDSATERVERLIATGYIANSRRFGSRVVDYPQHLTIEDTLDNLGRSFLGMTLSCARCHDHKFDPLTTRDYYGLYGVFHSTRYPWPGIELDQQQRNLVPLVPIEQRADTERKIAERAKEQSRLDGEVKQLKDKFKKIDKAKSADKSATEAELHAAQEKADAYRAATPAIELVYAVVEASQCEDVPVQIKGDPARPGDLVKRHFPAVLGGGELPPNHTASGRAELAEWILAADNPLPARVMVNRIWQYHFGRGIVPTPNDFGKQGKPASHPELLDFLATRFRHEGWSIKAMHRLIMLSHTYQQSSQRDSRALSEDPANIWLAGFPRRRLEAEAIRDTLLYLGRDLDLSAPGAHPFPAADTWKFTQHNPFKAVYDSDHRSVYLMTQRIQRHPYLAVFDGADPSTSTATRMTTTTPIQALFLLNDPLVHEQSARLADRIGSHALDPKSRIDLAYELLFARLPTNVERELATEFLQSASELLNDEGSDKAAWNAWVRTLIRLNEFVYID
ncbi:MAG: PSD1 and planctomycete cytochrome C domain-containing protein [Pirellulaceae bacterium]